MECWKSRNISELQDQAVTTHPRYAEPSIVWDIGKVAVGFGSLHCTIQVM